MWYSNDLDVARERHQDLIRQAEQERLILLLLENQQSASRSYLHGLGRQIGCWWDRIRFQIRLRSAGYQASRSH